MNHPPPSDLRQADEDAQRERDIHHRDERYDGSNARHRVVDDDGHVPRQAVGGSSMRRRPVRADANRRGVVGGRTIAQVGTASDPRTCEAVDEQRNRVVRDGRFGRVHEQRREQGTRFRAAKKKTARPAKSKATPNKKSKSSRAGKKKKWRGHYFVYTRTGLTIHGGQTAWTSGGTWGAIGAEGTRPQACTSRLRA